MPLHVVSEHAEEDVSSDATGEPVMDRPQLEIQGLEAAKGSFDIAQLLVAANHLATGKNFFSNVGANDVNSVELLFPLDTVGLACIRKPVLLDRDLVVLAHFEATEHAAHAQSDEMLAVQGALEAACRGGDFFQF